MLKSSSGLTSMPPQIRKTKGMHILSIGKDVDPEDADSICP